MFNTKVLFESPKNITFTNIYIFPIKGSYQNTSQEKVNYNFISSSKHLFLD